MLHVHVGAGFLAGEEIEPKPLYAQNGRTHADRIAQTDEGYLFRRASRPVAPGDTIPPAGANPWNCDPAHTVRCGADVRRLPRGRTDRALTDRALCGRKEISSAGFGGFMTRPASDEALPTPIPR
jgi:hypothetical protein